MMSMFTLDKLPKKALQKLDLQTVFMASRIIVAAEKLQIFRRLHKKPMSAQDLGRKIGIHKRHREPFLGVLVALGLLRKKDGLYRNTALADRYFVRERSIYWTRLYSGECMVEYERFYLLEKMLATGKNYESIVGKKSTGYLDTMAKNSRWASDFTHMLYHYHMPEARALANKLDLRGYRTLLDVGGGSGVMSIALARKYPRLRATVFDTANVIRTTKQIIRKEKMSRRITTLVGDMNREIPRGYDVCMFCDVDLTDHEPMLRTVYNRLPAGGMVVLVDEFASDDLTEPLHRMMMQLRSSRFWLTRRSEIVESLKQSGFKRIKRAHLCRENWMFTGQKVASGS